jgi:hypothetical protein
LNTDILDASVSITTLEQLANGGQQKRAGARLPEDGVAASVEGGLGLIRRPTRHHNHDDVARRGVRTELAAEIQPIHDGHLEVGNDDVRESVSRRIKRHDSVLGRRDLHSGSIQKGRMDLSDVLNVVHNEDPMRLMPASVQHLRELCHAP